MRVINTAATLPSDLSDWEKEQVYNGMDCCITYEVLNEIRPQLDNHTAATYNFSRDLQGPVIDMRLRGIRVDQRRRREVIAEFIDHMDVLERNLDRLALDGACLATFNWKSNPDLHKLFYDRLRIPPIKRGGRPTVDRAALERLTTYTICRPFVAHILSMRDIAKKISFLSTEIDDDGRIRTSYNIAGTSTGRFSSSYSEFGTGCVRPTAEALTRTGWKQLRHIGDGEEIAQWDQGEITFVRCRMHVERFDGELLQLSGEQIKLAVTPSHRVLYWDYNNPKKRVAPASSVVSKHQVYLPLGGTIHGALTYPSFLPMLMADFTMEGAGWRGAFKKVRKIERVLEIAAAHNLEIREHSAVEGYRRFYIKGFCDLPKKWGSWILELSAECAEELIEEARHWDAHDRGSGYIFYTADQEQAEWFATLAHLAGRGATMRQMEQGEYSWSTTTMWSVNVKNRDYVQVLPKHWSRIHYVGDVFCPQVASSFWLVREDGYISVTGNTNLQNVEESLRSVLISDPGMKFAKFDAKSGESYCVGAIEWNLFNDGRYLDACESGDVHTATARVCWPKLPWTGDIHRDKDIAEQPYYRHYSYRFMCKKLGHGSNYEGQAETLAEQAKVPPPVVVEFQAGYFKVFPAHLSWHDWVRDQIRRHGMLVSLTGRKRHFFGRRNSPDTIREAIAFDPQGSLADVVNRAMLRIWRENPCQLMMQDHDALTFQYPEEQENEIIPQLLELLPEEIELNRGRTLCIPYDCKVGWNRGEYDVKKNPDGLKDWGQGDQRRRTPEVRFLDRVVRRTYK